jgi:diguanylate cyclase (GGDEF)-like protein
VTVVVVVVLAVTLAIAVATLVLAYGSRSARTADGGEHAAVSSRPREDLAAGDVEDELQRTRGELRRARQLVNLAETLDLDEVLGRVLQSAAVLADADAAAVVLFEEGEHPVVKAMNLSPEEALPLLGGWHQESAPRAMTVRYRPPAQSAPTTSSIHVGALLPLVAEQETPVGTLGVFWRRQVDDPTEEQVAAIEELAAMAGHALENARRFHELFERSVRDPLTGLHNRHYFHETLALEVKRAHRYDRRLALIFFDIDDFKAINEEIGHLGGDAVLAEVAQRLRSVVRGADLACRVGGDEFAVLLPESSIDEARRLFQRLQLAVQGQPVGPVPTLRVSAGIAELGRDDDSMSLFGRVDQALYRAKRSGKGTVAAAEEALE